MRRSSTPKASRRVTLAASVVVILAISLYYFWARETVVGKYISSDFYSGGESGDMFGFELQLYRKMGAYRMVFTEYSGGLSTIEVSSFSFDDNTRELKFEAPVSLLNGGNKLIYLGRLTEEGIIGKSRYFQNNEFIKEGILHFNLQTE